MAQGSALKKTNNKAPTAKRSGGSSQKKGRSFMGSRIIAPKKASLVKKNKVTKKLTSGLTARTEQTLGERAGHLELVAAGKKKEQEKRNKSGAGGGTKGKSGK